MTTLKLGRTAPHDPATHPRIMFRDALAAARSYPPAPSLVDYISKVTAWPMYGNDEVGDCTCAAAGHMIEAWTAYGQGHTVEVTDADVLKAYEAVSGYRPGDPSTDTGANMQDVLDYWRKTGIGGHKILAFAEVNVADPAEVEAALALFGHIYVGVNFPAAAMDQFDAGEPWSVVDQDGGIEGGHAIDWGYASAGHNHEVITWGQPQQVTPQWMAKYAEEMWVVVDQEWINANGLNPEGVSVAALGEAFEAITGEPSPFPIEPTPQPPSPAPGPAPDSDPDVALVTALDGWAHERHEGANRRAAEAYLTWKAAKHLG